MAPRRSGLGRGLNSLIPGGPGGDSPSGSATLVEIPVADLVPHRGHSAQSLEAAVQALQAFPRIQGVADAEVAGFVSEGRR